MRDAVLLFVIVCGGTGGEIAVARAMKKIGEVHNFSPRNIFRPTAFSRRCWQDADYERCGGASFDYASLRSG